MILPQSVADCLCRLEEAGFAAYAVGGCVRDSLLGLTPQDFDLCTAALPEQTEAVFRDRRLVLAGKKHGTIGVVTEDGVIEITTFRTEGNYEDNRHPQWVHFVPDVEADLARRDFTINAMAYSPTRGFADPFGGRQDLENHILRTVGDPAARFQEDSLRILRGARFASKYHLTPDSSTLEAMVSLRSLMNNLACERVYDELCKLITVADWQDLLRFAPVIGAAIPELEPQFGFDQRSPHHAYDLFTHTAKVTAALPGDLALRWAGLLHDTGKIPTFTTDDTGRGHFYGHAPAGADIADGVLRRLKAPTALREEVVTLISLHMVQIPPQRKTVRRWLSRLGEKELNALLCLQEADMSSKGTVSPQEMEPFSQVRGLIATLLEEDACLSLKDLAVKGGDLMQLGIAGREIGACLNHLLNLVLEDTLPNEKAALCQAAQVFHRSQQSHDE